MTPIENLAVTVGGGIITAIFHSEVYPRLKERAGHGIKWIVKVVGQAKANSRDEMTTEEKIKALAPEEE